MSRFDEIDIFEDDLNEKIPQEVLNDPSWEPRLLPDLDNMDMHYTYDDIIEEENG